MTIINKKFKALLEKEFKDFLREQYYIGIHNHSEYSNLRLVDCINVTEALVDTAIELGHRGFGISDHECISGHIRLIKYVKSLKELKKKFEEKKEMLLRKGETLEEVERKLMKQFHKDYNKLSNMHKDFKLILGNEIYLVDSLEEVRDNYQSGVTKFPHFVLQALDKEGHRQLRELSSHAWSNSFYTGKLERTPTTKEKLREVVSNSQGHLICSTACLGGELAQKVLEYLYAIKDENITQHEMYQLKIDIHKFITYCIEVFGKEHFYIEIQPSLMEEQIEFNKMAIELAKAYGVKFIITTDTHYLRPEHRQIHKAYLNSKEGDREVDDFYSSTYMMNMEEMWGYVSEYMSEEDFKIAVLNTLDIWDKAEEYDLFQVQQIPQRELPQHFEVKHIFKDWYSKLEYLNNFAKSEEAQDQFLLYLVEQGFLAKKQEFNDTNVARIDTEMKELWLISEKLGQRMSSYYNLVELLIDLMWEDKEGNSIVGVARGSVTGYYICYLMSITQINPIEWELPHFRHLTALRPELPDVDVDSESLKRARIFEVLKNHFGWDRVLNIATFRKEGSKSAVKTSARGLGIDNDIAQAVAQLIPFERGSNWSLSDCVYGNEEKDRKPVKEFISEIRKYPNWLETAMSLENLISGRGIHASGTYIFAGKYIDQNAMMKAPNGVETTCWSMEDSDYCGAIKYDILTIKGADKIRKTLDLLLDKKKIEWQGTLRATYNKYIHPDVLDYETKEMWKMVSTGELIDLFQFSTPIGITTAKQIKPTKLIELAHANSLMRLMGDGTITPTEKYLLFRNNIQLWYDEMEQYGLSKEEVECMEYHLLKYSGVSATQEDIMLISMDKRVADFDIPLANKLRKSIAKKKEKLVAEIKEIFYQRGLEKGNRINILDYVWDKHVVPQLGYSFSICHTTPYSVICLQQLNLAYKYGSLFWNTAVLTINSCANEEDALDDETESNKKAIPYGKIAKAIGEVKSGGVVVSLPNVNKSNFSFEPDEEQNRIIYGLKGICGVGEEVVVNIMKLRPFTSFTDFLEKIEAKSKEIGANLIKKGEMVSLIKCGAFEELEPNKPRDVLMREYIGSIAGTNTKLTASNLEKLIEFDLIPDNLKLEARYYKFKKYITNKNFYLENVSATKRKFLLDSLGEKYFFEWFGDEAEENKCYFIDENGVSFIDKEFEKIYKKKVIKLTDWIKTPEAIKNYNETLLRNEWNKRHCQGSLSKWEMDTLGFYYNEHELKDLKKDTYSLVNFFELPEVPEIETSYKKGETTINIMKLHRLCGTVIDKDNNKSIVQLLTPDGVVALKFNKGSYNHYNKRLSVVNEETGKKEVIEESWFKRGTKLLVVGFRREDQFVVKKYSRSIYEHTVEKINDLTEEGYAYLSHERKQVA